MSALLLVGGIIFNFYKFGFAYGILANIIWFVIWNIVSIMFKTKRNFDHFKDMDKERDRKYNIK